MITENTTPKITFEHICKSYDNHNVLKDICMTIQNGEFLTIMGPSGCGKTTLLKMLNLLVTPTSGNLLIDNKNILTFNPIQLRRRIGYALQNAVLFPNMDVLDNIMFVPNLLSKKEREELNLNIDKCLDTVRLDRGLVHRYPDELSGGQQQRVAIARALAANPDILLMDEPFSAVDEITREELQNEIIRIHEITHLTVLFVTHDVHEALKLGEKVLILNQGSIEQLDTPEKIVKNPASPYVEKLLSIKNSNS